MPLPTTKALRPLFARLGDITALAALCVPVVALLLMGSGQ